MQMTPDQIMDEVMMALINSHRMTRKAALKAGEENAELEMQAKRDAAAIACLKTKLRSLAQKAGKRGKGRKK